MPIVDLIASLETIAGAHGIGRIDMVENRLVGIKSREIYEAPAAVALHAAHQELEKMVIPRDLERLKHDAGRTYADLVYNGLWFTPTREALDAFAAKIQERVTGTIRLKFFKRRLPRRRTQVAVRALRARAGDLRCGRPVRPLGRRRLHQDLGPAGRDRGAEGAGASEALRHGLRRRREGVDRVPAEVDPIPR